MCVYIIKRMWIAQPSMKVCLVEVPMVSSGSLPILFVFFPVIKSHTQKGMKSKSNLKNHIPIPLSQNIMSALAPYFAYLWTTFFFSTFHGIRKVPPRFIQL